MRPGPTIATFSLCWAFAAASAHAAPGSAFVLDWQAPEECPSSDEVRGEIFRLLGGASSPPRVVGFRVRASVEHQETWQVALETEVGSRVGRRAIEAASCLGLANATALIVALMIDPEAVAAQSNRPHPDAPATTPASTPAPTPAAATFAWGPKRRTGSELLVGVHLAGTTGPLPGSDLALLGSLGIVSGALRVEASAGYSLRRDQRADAAGSSGAYGQFNWFTSQMTGCFSARRPIISWGPCLAVSFGRVSAHGSGGIENYSVTEPWLALNGGGFLAVAAGERWRFPIHVDAVVPLLRPAYSFRANVPVFQSAVVGGRLTAGVELGF